MRLDIPSKLPMQRTHQHPSTEAERLSSSTLLTRHEVAQRWHCCPHSVARRKNLRPLRLSGRMLRYRMADVLAVEAQAFAM